MHLNLCRVLLIAAALVCDTPAFAQAPDAPEPGNPPLASMGARVKTRITTSVEKTIGFAKREPLLPSFWDDAKRIPSLETVAWIGAFGGLSLASRSLDATTNQRLRGGSVSDSLFSAGSALGENTSLMAVGGGLYVWGRWKHESSVAHLGSDLFRGEIESEFLTEGIKMAVKRPRPDGLKHTSFPSGHAASAFTAATVLQRHYGLKVGIPAYSVASYVAASRLHDNKHYLSDVVFGAGIGIALGRAVTHVGRADYTLAPRVVRGGWALMISRVPSQN